MKFTNFNKWFCCFVEWEENGEKGLSCIPWRGFISGKLSERLLWGNDDKDAFRWKWVPPWKVQIGNAE